jgi:hypothetical protein
MLKGCLIWINNVVFKLLLSIFISVLSYEYFLSSLHAEFYAHRHGMSRAQIEIGDGFFIFVEAIFLLFAEIIFFYFLIDQIFKKFIKELK